MSLIALTSAKGSPGVTTTALALAWTWPARRPVAAFWCWTPTWPAGHRARVLARRRLGCRRPPRAGLRSRTRLATSMWSSRTLALDEHGDSPGAARRLGPGPGPRRWPVCGRRLPRRRAGDRTTEEVDVIVDLGRLGTVDEATALSAGSRPRSPGHRRRYLVASARSAARRLRRAAPRGRWGAAAVACLLVGESDPYGGAGDRHRASGVERWPGIRRRRGLRPGPPASWRFTRSALMRSARSVRQLSTRPPSARPRRRSASMPRITVTSVLAANEARLREVAPPRTSRLPGHSPIGGPAVAWGIEEFDPRGLRPTPAVRRGGSRAGARDPPTRRGGTRGQARDRTGDGPDRPAGAVPLPAHRCRGSPGPRPGARRVSPLDRGSGVRRRRGRHGGPVRPGPAAAAGR